MGVGSYRREFKFTAKDGKSINTYLWDNVDEIKGIVQIFHGMSEHGLRYEHFALFLNKSGYVVVANDHRGHGKTESDIKGLGVIGKDGFNMIVDDEYTLYKIIKKRYPDAPFFVLGHSFGSFVAQEYITRYGNQISGVVLSGTAMQKGIDITLGRQLASIQRKIFGEEKKAHLLNKLSFGNYNKKIPDALHKFSWLSTDEEMVIKYERDPLCGGVVSIGFYYYMLRAFRDMYLQNRLTCIPRTLPILILSGEEDPVGCYGAKVKKLYELYKKHGIDNIQMKLYSKMRHEILNEKKKLEVYKDILSWLIANV